MFYKVGSINVDERKRSVSPLIKVQPIKDLLGTMVYLH